MMQIYRSKDQGYAFYGLMGPFFADLKIAKELERQVYNKPNTEWFVITYHNTLHTVRGFASVHDNGKHYFIDNLYVRPEYRRNGDAGRIIGEIVNRYHDKPFMCLANHPAALKIFSKYGFVEVGQCGKYKRLAKYPAGISPV